MNEIFSFSRFRSLFRKTVLERPAQMFGFPGLIVIAVLIFFAIGRALVGFNGAQHIAFIWGFTGGGCVFASFAFAYFSTNANGSSYLALPASQFEKWLCGILIAGILYPAVFLSFFRVIDIVFVALYHHSLNTDDPNYKDLYDQVYVFPFDGLVAGRIYKIFCFFAGTMLLGSLYFNKVTFIKVGLIICGLCIAGYALNWLIAMAFFGNIGQAFPFSMVSIPVGKDEGVLELPASADRFVALCMSYILPVLLAGLSFIRLREKEF